ncbi:conjugal transfer protein MobB [Myroides sp. N17-2]|uniref:conjugal transfer protein MobB n=1 Tax=Myroides sp. N17-2 TaxID=2030799 RepID=UPI000EFAAFDB|nr:conjugal transfer protein MobB [Myroides sp. N17-2]
MIVKIGKGKDLLKTLSYNQVKVDNNKGSVLFTNNLPEPYYNASNFVALLYKHFEPYLLLNYKTEKIVRHISLNPNPVDKISDDILSEIAKQYMKEMGYDNQPYIVYKHSDIEREHIHIVTVCTDLQGKQINDSYDYFRSVKVCHEIEKQFNLTPAIKRIDIESNQIQFRPVDYTKDSIKTQIASVIRHLPKYYNYDSLENYNALLSLFNITAKKVEVPYYSQLKLGLVYFALDNLGKIASNPLKASLFGKSAGYHSLVAQFEKSKDVLQKSKTELKEVVEIILDKANSLESFINTLIDKGINIVIFKNNDNRVYGASLIDHNSKAVYKDSELSQSLPTNILNKNWSVSNEAINVEQAKPKKGLSNKEAESKEVLELHPIFDYLNSDLNSLTRSDFVSFFNLFSNNLETDDNELELEKKLKRKKKGRSF